MKAFYRAVILLFFLLSIISSCDKKSPTKPKNSPPKIQSISANPTKVQTNGISILSVVATDADKDKLSYSWSSNFGEFPEGINNSSVRWKAPDTTGNYNCSVVVSDGKDIALDSIKVNVEKPPILSITPIILDFGDTTNTMTFQINNKGTGTINWSATTDSNWLSIAPKNGSITTETQTVIVLVNRTGLNPGAYRAIIQVTSNGGNIDVTVQMQVPSNPLLSVKPQLLDFGELKSEMKITISNIGTGILSWNISTDKNWISILPMNGTTTSEVDSVFIQIIRSHLSPGTYTGSINVNSNGDSSVVSVHVIQPQEFNVPVLISPINGSVINDDTPAFDWHNVTSAVDYQIQIDNENNFDSPVTDKIGLTISNYTPQSSLSDNIYYWRVRARVNIGNWGGWSSVWSFTVDTQPPPSPILLNPSDGSEINDNTPTFEWEDVQGVLEYHIQIDTENNFISPVIDISTLTAITYTPTSLLADGTYYWRIKAKDAAGNWSNWSSIWRVSIDTQGPPAPSLISPSDDSTTNNNTPSLEWSDVTGAIEYQLQVDNNGNFSSPTLNQTGITNSNYTLISSLPDDSYYWRVRAKNSKNNWGEWSEVWSFTIDTKGPIAPTLVSPANTSSTNDNTPTLDWHNVTDAEEYQIQIDSNSNFTSPQIDKVGITNSTYTTLSSLSDGTYYWRVRAKDNLGNWGGWSSGWSFTIDTQPPPFPTLLSPADGSEINDNTPMFDWDDVKGVTEYQIQVDLDNNFTSPGIDKSGLTSSTYTPASSLADETYYWRVKAKDAAGNLSDWSAIWSITIDTEGPVAPSLISPINGSTINDDTPIYEWSDVIDATYYQLQVDNNSNFSSPVENISDITISSYAPTSSLADGNYYWRVRARDKVSNWGNWSLISSFTFKRLKWSYDLGQYGGSPPSIGLDGTVLVTNDYNEKLFAIDSEGNLKWKLELNVYDSPSIGTDGTLYIVSRTDEYSESYYLIALNIDGSEKWKYEIVKYGYISIGSDQTIYVGTSGYNSDNYLYAFTKNGELKWKYKFVDNSVVVAPIIDFDNNIYVVLKDNYLYAFQSDGQLKWRLLQGNGVISAPAIGADGTIYISSMTNSLFALNPDGSLKLEFVTGNFNSSPTIGSDGTIYIASYDDYLYAINSNSSIIWKRKWRSDYLDYMSSPTIGLDGTIYLGYGYDTLGFGKGKVSAFNPDGTLKWIYDAGTNMGSVPAISSDGTLYWHTGGGELVAVQSSSLGLANSYWPRDRHDNQNTGSAK